MASDRCSVISHTNRILFCYFPSSSGLEGVLKEQKILKEKIILLLFQWLFSNFLLPPSFLFSTLPPKLTSLLSLSNTNHVEIKIKTNKSHELPWNVIYLKLMKALILNGDEFPGFQVSRHIFSLICERLNTLQLIRACRCERDCLRARACVCLCVCAIADVYHYWLLYRLVKGQRINVCIRLFGTRACTPTDD